MSRVRRGDGTLVVHAVGQQMVFDEAATLGAPGNGPLVGPVLAPLLAADLACVVQRWDALGAHWHPSSVVEARVAVRRARSNLSTFRSVLDDAWVDEVRDQLRPVGQLLSVISRRDALHALAIELWIEVGADASVTARLVAGRAVRQAQVAVGHELLAGHAAAAVRRQLELAAQLGPPLRADLGATAWQPCAEVVPGLVRKPWAELRRAAKELDGLDRTAPVAPVAPVALAAPAERVERVERLRTTARHCRYAAELAAPVVGPDARRLAERARALQITLRRLRDAEALVEWFEDEADRSTAARRSALARRSSDVQRQYRDCLADRIERARREVGPCVEEVLAAGRPLGRQAKGVTVRASGGVVWRRQDGVTQVVLVHRPEQQDWSIPKGKATRGESLEQCARREVFEETGLACAIGREVITQTYRERRGFTKCVTYFAMTPETAPDATSGPAPDRPTNGHDGEVDLMVWLPIEVAMGAVTKGRDRKVLQAFAQALASGVPAGGSGAATP